MSAFGKHGARCDKCGKFSRNRQGEYVRKDGSAGYIMPEDNENGSERDICSDCVESRANPMQRLSESERPKVRQQVIWLESRKWGGKQNTPAIYLHGVGTKSARIELADKSEKTVRLSSLQWS